MIRIAIVGYGNLGKACERIAYDDNDFQVAGIFTRRAPSSLVSPFGTPFYWQEEIYRFEDDVDVACICTGSANDVTELGKKLASKFNTVDSFDTHAKMCDYAANIGKIAEESGHLSFVGIGWDPGVFSLIRALFDGVLKHGVTQTFWGRGVSQGHSEAIRRIEGVEDAKQYTVPIEGAIEAVRAGGGAELKDGEKHRRECYVVAKDGADCARIEREIVTMPNYFAPYETTVRFIDKKQFAAEHGSMRHGGFVLRCGQVGETTHRMEMSLQLDSNPDFTASVLMAYAKANAAMSAAGERGARTALDIPVSALLGGTDTEKIKGYV